MFQCTCIGEEGLDIGEVDLIVNFDTLSSPIRSLQRIGRTGRQREGRVVCLVSEGAEEKTLNSSKQKERTLQHALKSQKNFTTRLTVPMFEGEPALSRIEMNFSQHFRQSQVEGTSGVNRKESNKSLVANSTRWRLTDDEDSQRLNILRQYTRVQLSLDRAGASSLRRRLLAGRSLKITSRSTKDRFIGNTALSLRKFEASHDRPNEALPKVVRVRGCRDGNDDVLDSLFPLFPDAASSGWDVALKYANNGVAGTSIAGIAVDDSVVPSEGVGTVSDLAKEPASAGGQKPRIDAKHCEDTALVGTESSETTTTIPVLHAIPACPFTSGRDGKAKITMQGSSHFEEFCLPTPPDSGSSSEEEEEDDVEMKDLEFPLRSWNEMGPEVAKPAEALLTTRINATDSNNSEDAERMPSTPENKTVLDDFRLPTPASSSDESDGDLEDTYEAKFVTSKRSDSIDNAKNETVSSVFCLEGPSDDASHQSWWPPSGRVRFSDAAGRETATQSTAESETPFQLPVKKTKKNSKVIQDTPESEPKLHNPYAACKRKSVGSLSCDLTNTQDELSDAQGCGRPDDTADDIICAVCMSGNSPDEDPIILCDGERSLGQQCNLSVHMTCYSVIVPLRSDEDWFCDPCIFRKTGFSCLLRCVECKGGEDSGALKQIEGGLWRHVKCRATSNKPQRLKKLGKPPIPLKVAKESKRSPLKRLSSNNAEVVENMDVRKRRRQDHVLRFVQEEADCESEDDVVDDDDEEALVRAIEEEEAEEAEGFINDSSQLDYTQDVLGRLDPDANDDMLHRELDHDRERREEFATPCLGRRFLRRQQGNNLSDAMPTQSLPSSKKGLGKMHFIRSVLEHHRQGGSAEDIEQAFNYLEAAGTQADLSELLDD